MPNAISQQDLEDLRLPELARNIKLVRAGGIRPYASRGACHAHVDDVVGCVLYAQIVGGRVKKFGTANSLMERMKGNVGAINEILAFQDGRSTSQAQWLKDYARGKMDQFKKQAPDVIRAGQEIEVWATSLSTPDACQDPKKRRNGQCDACKKVEGALNGRYQTIKANAINPGFRRRRQAGSTGNQKDGQADDGGSPPGFLNVRWAAAQGKPVSSTGLFAVAADQCEGIKTMRRQVDDVRRIVAVGPVAPELGRVGGLASSWAVIAGGRERDSRPPDMGDEDACIDRASWPDANCSAALACVTPM